MCSSSFQMCKPTMHIPAQNTYTYLCLNRNMAIISKHQQAHCTLHANSEFKSEGELSAETGIQMVIMFRMMQFQSYVLKQNCKFKNVETHTLRSGLKNIQSLRKDCSYVYLDVL